MAQVVRKLRPVAGWLMTTLSTETHSYAVSGGVKSEEEFLLLSDGTTWVRLSGATHSYTYNHLGQLPQVTDVAGIRSIGYNAYGEQETDSLLADGNTHLITETRDALGRSTGFTYAKDGAVQHTVTTGYGAFFSAV